MKDIFKRKINNLQFVNNFILIFEGKRVADEVPKKKSRSIDRDFKVAINYQIIYAIKLSISFISREQFLTNLKNDK